MYVCAFISCDEILLIRPKVSRWEMSRMELLGVTGPLCMRRMSIDASTWMSVLRVFAGNPLFCDRCIPSYTGQLCCRRAFRLAQLEDIPLTCWFARSSARCSTVACVLYLF